MNTPETILRNTLGLDQLPPLDENNFLHSISIAAQFCPQVAENEQEIRVAAQTLMDIYQPTSDFFAASDNTIGLLFASSLYANARNTEGKAPKRIARETALADSFSWLVFGDYSVTRPHEEQQRVSNLSAKERIALFRKYENPELSNYLGEWMNANPGLSEVRNALGITRDESKDFIPIVLRAGTQKHLEIIKKVPTQQDLRAQIKEWQHNAKQFMIEQGSREGDTLPLAWVSVLDGESYLCLPEPLAVLVLDPELANLKDNTGRHDYIQALIKHEYVHVQTKLKLVDSNNDQKAGHLGKLLSEYQAEIFSGFHFSSAYSDVYSLVEDVDGCGHMSLQEIIARHKKVDSANKPRLYFDLINSLGLVAAAMLIATPTRNDMQHQSMKASKLFKKATQDYCLIEELTLRNGWEGVVASLKRNGIPLDEELTNYYHEWLNELANS